MTSAGAAFVAIATECSPMEIFAASGSTLAATFTGGMAVLQYIRRTV
ncbi:hypothetical protein ACIQMR_35050 [Streptomyces sp. NPDC091376]